MDLLPEDFSADDLRQVIRRMKPELQDKGFTAPQAATIILDGVRSGAWRILVGDDAHRLDDLVRRSPEQAYDVDFFARPVGITARGAGGER